MRHITTVLNLWNDVELSTRVESAIWDSEQSRWIVSVNGGSFVTTTYLAVCTGYAGRKYVPDIPGLASFEQAYHTSAWPQDLDVGGRRVGVIGTGSSGTQVIETIGSRVKHLTVFQRTPNLANPRRQQLLTPEASANERTTYPDRYKAMHKSPTGLEVTPVNRYTFDDDHATRWALYESLWEKGAQNFWFGNYKDLLTDKDANREAYGFWRSKVGPRINDPAKRSILCPAEPPHAFGAKRPTLEENYFEVFNQANVDLVDLKSDPITEVTSEGVRTATGGFYELDIICLATGYDFAIGSQLAIDIRGLEGARLQDKWLPANSTKECSDTAGVLTFLGLMTHGFPNLIFPAGPQAPTAFGITPRLAEQQGDWLADMLAHIRDKGYTVVESKKSAELWWKQACASAVESTLIAETDGWYMGNNVPMRKKETLFWFGGLPEYMRICEDIKDQGYQGFELH